MNVLVISHTYIAPVNRTKWQEFAKRYPSATLTVLVPNRWKTSFFDVESGPLKNDNLKNCTFLSLPTYLTGNELLYFYSPLKFAKLLLRTKPDIIHVEQGLCAASYLQAIMFNKILRLKALCSFFTWINWQPKLGFKTKMLTKILGFFTRAGSSAAIAGNHDAKKILATTKATLPVLVLPQLGVDPKLFKPAQRTDHYDEKKYIAYVGRLVEEKGLTTLFKAFTNLAHEFPSWHLVVIGAGSMEKQLIDFAISKKLIHRIEFRTPVTHEKIAAMLQPIDILVLPSLDTSDWREQFGHVLIEAMACRVCVVGSDAGEIPHVIANTGRIFKQGDDQALTQTLEGLMANDSLRNHLAQKGFERVMHEYTHSVIAEKTYQFWQSLLTPNKIKQGRT